MLRSKSPLMLLLASLIIASVGSLSSVGASSAETPWTNAQVVSIDAFSKMLNSSSKPVVIQVGPESLYKSSHIPGAIFAGPGMDSDGINKLREAAAKIPHTKTVVIYCGCCPFKNCPNVKPAFSALKQMGFKNLLVLDLPNGFGPDWVSKGLPVERQS